MQELHDWIDEKLSHGFGTILEHLTVTHEFKKQACVSQYAQLTIDLFPADSFSLDIVLNVEDEGFRYAIKNALFGFLLNQSFSPLLNLEIKIHSIKSHPINSSYAAFHAVTKTSSRNCFWLKEIVNVIPVEV